MTHRRRPTTNWNWKCTNDLSDWFRTIAGALGFPADCPARTDHSPGIISAAIHDSVDSDQVHFFSSFWSFQPYYFDTILCGFCFIFINTIYV